MPSIIDARCYIDVGVYTLNPSDCEIAGERHGSAVTEAAYDIAPDATYYISNPISGGDVQDTVAWMIDHGVEIINMSLEWTWTGPGDGSTAYSNSALNAVDTAVADGITWINAAGNTAQSTWYGDFKDTNGDGLHEFSGTDNCNNYALYDGGQIHAARFIRDVPISVQLRWDDRWDGAEKDLNLIMVRWNEGTEQYEELGRSALAQSGGADHTPYEFLRGTVPAGVYCLAIRHISGPVPDWIQMQDFTGNLLQQHTPHHSISEPSESKNPGLLAVGAAPASNINTIEPYSSRGPTNDGRIKPDIVGVARGQSVSYRSTERPDGRWAGTSQASAHVAGLAALVKQRFPDHTPQEITYVLKSHAEGRGTVPNNTWGYGFARLLASDAPTPEPTEVPEPTDTPSPSPSPEPTVTPEPTATSEPTATPSADNCVEPISADGTINGSWTADCASESISGSYARYYTFTLAEDAQVLVTLQSTVNAYLYLLEESGSAGTILFENDDFASGTTHSVIQETLAAGDYTIEATTYDAGETGDFVLTVSELPAIAEPQPSPTPEQSPTPQPTPLTTPSQTLASRL